MSTTWSSFIGDAEDLYNDVSNDTSSADVPTAPAATTTPTWVWYLVGAAAFILVIIVIRD